MKQILLFNFIMVFSLLGYSQGVTTASMAGKVTDQAGSPLPGANVIITHIPSGSQYGTATDAYGLFRIPNMRVGGPYTAKVNYIGYSEVIKEGIALSLGQVYTLNLTLQESSETLDEVVITGSPSDVFNSEKTGARTTVSRQQLTSLPNASRDINDFTRLTPQASFTSGGGISIAGTNNRYNSIFIDGAVSNDVFGLAANGQNGGQVDGLSLISMDALDQITVSVAPYDVTLGGFSGAGISAVTRSGSNELEGSAYYLVRNQNLAGKTPTLVSEDDREKLADFTAKTYGFRLGGPIIKDKLFFFINGEIQRDQTPQPFNFKSYTGLATQQDLTSFSNALKSTGYDPGGYENVIQTLDASRFFIKLDYNINQTHKISIRNSYNKGESVSPANSNSSRIRFANAGVSFPSTTNSTTLELQSNFTNKSNKLILGYTTVTDNRDPLGKPYPFIIINTGDVQAGSEEFSTGNLLEQKIFTLTDNVNLFKGKHTLTIGTHNEFYNMSNVFIRQNFGSYRYNTIGDFLEDFNDLSQPATQYDRSYSLVDNTTGDNTNAAARFKALQLGLYAQDEYQASSKLKLTLGLRLDVPMFLDDPAVDEHFNTVTVPLIEAAGYDLQGARSGQAPEPQLLWAPRFGFNYDVNGNQTTQLRGGIGVFTSRVPFVWPGAMYNQNGVTVGGTRQKAGIDFNPDPLTQPTVGDFGGTDALPQGELDLFSENFKFPQVVRASIAVDQKLGFWGLIGTVEAMYSKTLNNIFYENVNVKKATAKLTGTPDDRPLFTNGRIDNAYQGMIYLGSNTNKGYSYNLTASLTKPFDNGLTLFAAYNFGRAEAIFEGTSSQNSSQWRGVYSVNGRNVAPLGRSDFAVASRVITTVSYKKSYLKDLMATTISIFYQGQSGSPFSYTYSNGLTGEDSRERALVFVPKEQKDIVFADAATADAQWAALNAYIENDDYLSIRRGMYAEKNMARTPFSNVVDLRLLQDINLDIANHKHTLQVSFDIFNFTNLLNKDWGRRYNVPNGDGTSVQLLTFNKLVQNPNSMDPDISMPTYTFNTSVVDKKDLLTKDDAGLVSSRWQMQLGLRYIF